ncbi:GNAT family N-acetyltransferase [Streptomyces sp. NBC_01210]|uniref:GNAT family N-acetyltransferase n=1 Tax=Streptomyces sp. NBC_01210 TaxID=2903774 RepID=UPI002E0FF651|nr:GNAT family N-acetyltransferase [Streptomyces sp. NBC_01210]
MVAPSTPAAVSVRAARPADVPAIAELSARFAAEDLLLSRTPAQIAGRVGEFLAAVNEVRLMGCVGLSRRRRGLLLYNLCVAPDAQGQGIGALLVDHAGRVGAALGCRLLVAVSKHSGHWFVQQGFTELTARQMPAGWAHAFPPGRGSRLYVRPVTQPGFAEQSIYQNRTESRNL